MRRVLALFPSVAALYAIIGGGLALLGWSLDLPRLADWDGDGIAMQPNTGLAALLFGIAFFLTIRSHCWPAIWLGPIITAIGALTLFEHASGIDLGIDQILLFDRQWGTRGTVAAGRMGVPGCLCWTMAGTALFLMRRRWPTHRAVPALGVCVAAIGLLSITGYLFSADPLYSLPSATAIAFQTATVLFTIGLALVAVAIDRQPLKSLLEDSAAGELARRGLPIVTLVPILIGWLCARGQRLGIFDSTMAIALLVLSLIGTLCVVLWAGVIAVAVREQSLRMSEDRFTRFMQHLPGLAWIKDVCGRYVYVNEAAVQAFRVPKDGLYGKTDAEIFDGKTALQFQDNDQKAVQSGKAVQVIETLAHEDGVIHHSIVSKFPIASADGQQTMVGGMAIDITERLRAEETVKALLRTSARLNSTLDVDALLDILVREAIGLIGAEAGVAGLLTTEGMVSKKYFQEDKELPLEYCWPRLHGLPGWLIENKKPYLTNDALSDKQIVHELCRKFGVRTALSTPIIAAQGELIGFFEIHNKKNGTGFTTADQEVLVALSQIAAVAVQNALAYRALQQAENALQESDRRKDEFLALLAHELRNPLAPIRTGLEIIMRGNGSHDDLKEAQQVMDRQLKHLVRLVDDLLDISRINRNKLELRMQRVELGTILQQALEISRPLADCEHQSIDLAVPERPIFVDADPIRLTQVFSNLLNNACKFSSTDDKIIIGVQREGSDAVISVTDNGVGIPQGALQRIFEMFTQVHQSFERPHRGLGIGLTLVRQLVEMHGGSVSAFSQGLGQGSRFVVRLPIVIEECSAPTRFADPCAVSQLPKKTILIVDDNEDAAATLATLMKYAGHEILLAHDGDEACVVAESARPDVILLDIGLPKMNGFEVCRAIRQKPWAADVVIVALSGWGQEDDRRQSSAAGFDAHLVKPVDNNALIQLLVQLCPAARP